LRPGAPAFLWDFSNPPAISDEIVVINYALNNGLTVSSRLRDLAADKLRPLFVCIGDMIAKRRQSDAVGA
jgi:hypothetical protein